MDLYTPSSLSSEASFSLPKYLPTCLLHPILAGPGILVIHKEKDYIRGSSELTNSYERVPTHNDPFEEREMGPVCFFPEPLSLFLRPGAP